MYNNVNVSSFYSFLKWANIFLSSVWNDILMPASLYTQLVNHSTQIWVPNCMHYSRSKGTRVKTRNKRQKSLIPWSLSSSGVKQTESHAAEISVSSLMQQKQLFWNYRCSLRHRKAALSTKWIHENPTEIQWPAQREHLMWGLCTYSLIYPWKHCQVDAILPIL